MAIEEVVGARTVPRKTHGWGVRGSVIGQDEGLNGLRPGNRTCGWSCVGQLWNPHNAISDAMPLRLQCWIEFVLRYPSRYYALTLNRDSCTILRNGTASRGSPRRRRGHVVSIVGWCSGVDVLREDFPDRAIDK